MDPHLYKWLLFVCLLGLVRLDIEFNMVSELVLIDGV